MRYLHVFCETAWVARRPTHRTTTVAGILLVLTAWYKKMRTECRRWHFSQFVSTGIRFCGSPRGTRPKGKRLPWVLPKCKPCDEKPGRGSSSILLRCIDVNQIALCSTSHLAINQTCVIASRYFPGCAKSSTLALDAGAPTSSTIGRIYCHKSPSYFNQDQCRRRPSPHGN